MSKMNDPENSSRNPSGPEPWYYRYQLVFRSYDQVAVVFVIVLSMSGMIFYFSYRAHVENGLIDIDQIDHQNARYLVDINSAEWPEIANLPGIGPKLANAIVDFRLRNGGFADHDSLIRVSGIGPIKLERLREYLAPIRGVANE